MTTKQGENRLVTGKFAPNTSGNPRGRPRKRFDEAEFAAKRQAILTRLDAWNNPTTGLGILGKDKVANTSFVPDVVDSELGAQMWRGDPIGAKIVEWAPNEALRQGYELCIGDDETVEPYEPEQLASDPKLTQPRGAPDLSVATGARKDRLPRALARVMPSAFSRRVQCAVRRARYDAGVGDAKPLQEKVSKRMRDLQVDYLIRETMHFERALCAGALLIGANDYTTDLRLPLDLRKVRSLDYLTPIEARELQPLYFYNDPFAPKFGQVAIYQLVPQIIGTPISYNFKSAVTQIHESRLIVFPGIKTTRRMLTGVINGFGDNVFTRVFRALRGWNSSIQSVETLLSDFAQAIYKIKGLADLILRDKNALTDAMMNVELGRSIARAVVIDSEEEFERKSTTMTGYADSLDRLGIHLCAAADMTQEQLLGLPASGLNANGQSGIRIGYDRVSSLQTMRVAPALIRVVEILLASFGEDPENVNHSITFKPLWQPTEKEIAEARKVQAETDQIYLTEQVTSPEEIALSRFGGDQYSFETHIDFESRHAQVAIAPPTVEAKPKPTPPMLQVGQPPQAAQQPDPTTKIPEE